MPTWKRKNKQTGDDSDFFNTVEVLLNHRMMQMRLIYLIYLEKGIHLETAKIFFLMYFSKKRKILTQTWEIKEHDIGSRREKWDVERKSTM